ncbi:MAG: pyridoxal phosphate-dependent aminotransferase [Clostridia bacterium]|nr:pyridoxal phosphate-dependent aminotransferase [Clostridia bacterium]
MYISEKAKRVKPSSTLAITSKFKAMKAEGIDAVGFGAGEPDFDTPEEIKNACKDALTRGVTKYTPASGTAELKKAICRKLLRDNGLNYQPADIVISNGAKHSLTNIFMAICNPGDEVIIPAPFWVSYPEMVAMADGKSIILNTTEENEFKISAADFEAAITPKTRAIIINSPSNPTGSVYTEEELQKIADVAVKHDIYVISDEVYEHLIYDDANHVSIASLGEDIKKLTIVVNAMSKTYAMTGWRIGYTACEKELATAMANIQSHATSNPNSFAQAASCVALDGSLDCVKMMKAEFKKRRDYMYKRINEIAGVSCIMPKGAFYIMMNIEQIIGHTMYGKMINGSDDFADLFLEKALVAVVPCSGFGADSYLRWSYATSMESIEKGLDRLEKFIRDGLDK